LFPVIKKKLFKDLAYDASDVNIRCSVLEGVMFILENHLSHPLLKVLLPQLSSLIHDKSDRVVLLMVKLLLAVKRLRTFKFYEIVSQPHLLHRLTMGNNNISAAITELLLSSYFPYTKSTYTQLRRVLVLLRMNPVAARTFFCSGI